MIVQKKLKLQEVIFMSLKLPTVFECFFCETYHSPSDDDEVVSTGSNSEVDDVAARIDHRGKEEPLFCYYIVFVALLGAPPVFHS